jgi:hypothetical protein
LIAALGAVTRAASAQATPPPPDTILAVAVVRPTPDSIFAPLPRAEAPAPLDGGFTHRWVRDELFRSGAMNLAELLDRIPGVSLLRSGLLLSPQVLTWWGDPTRVRVFLDGVELDQLDARSGAARDLGVVDLWTLEEVSAETTPAELRVHLRSWRVDRRVPETRVDVYTGDDDSNLYRGFFGRRFASGLAAQFGFQQFSSVNRQQGGDGDALSLFARAGWARRDWSFDAAVHRENRTRNATLRVDESPGVPPFAGGTTHLIGRASYRTPDSRGLWGQLAGHRGTWREAAAGGDGVSAFSTDTVDTLVTRRQFMGTAGLTAFGVRLSGTGRYRTVGDAWYFTPSARASWERWGLAASAFLEHNAEDSIARLDVSARYRVRRWLSAEFGASDRAPMWTNPEVAATAWRGLGRMQLFGWELSGGALSIPAATIRPIQVFNAGYDTVTVPARSATLFGASGPLYRVVRLDLHATQWEAVGPYRPATELRARVHMETEWRQRFPRGDFTFRGSLEYRNQGETIAPLATGDLTLIAASTWTSVVELRIRTATITWQFRNNTGTVYESVAGFRMPQRVNLYGIRWNFAD